MLLLLIGLSGLFCSDFAAGIAIATAAIAPLPILCFFSPLHGFHFSVAAQRGATNASEEPNASNEPPPATESV